MPGEAGTPPSGAPLTVTGGIPHDPQHQRSLELEKTKGKWALYAGLPTAIAAVVGALLAAGVFSGDANKPDAKPPATTAPVISSPSAALSAPPLENSPGSTEPTVATESTGPVEPGPSQPRNVTLSTPRCLDSVDDYVDFDAERIARQMSSPDLTDAEFAEFEMRYEGCGGGEITITSDRAAGILPKDSPANLQTCRDTANRGSLSRITDWNEPSQLRQLGIEPGAALCFVTDKQKVVLAKIVRIGDNNGLAPAIELSVTTWG
jgi:hypothetical protein